MFVSPGKVHGSRQGHDTNVTQTFSALGIYITCFSLPSTLNTQCRDLIFSLFTMISDDLSLKKTYQYFLKTKANATKRDPNIHKAHVHP